MRHRLSLVRGVALLAGLIGYGLSMALMVRAGLGPGPCDGLMTGLVARTGLSVRLVRTTIETTVLAAGWLLGGTVGVGTVVYAFGIGPLVQLILRFVPTRVLGEFGAKDRMTTMTGCPKQTTPATQTC